MKALLADRAPLIFYFKPQEVNLKVTELKSNGYYVSKIEEVAGKALWEVTCYYLHCDLAD